MSNELSFRQQIILNLTRNSDYMTFVKDQTNKNIKQMAKNIVELAEQIAYEDSWK